MPSFEDALKASVDGVDQGFRTAEKDLQQEVTVASNTIIRITSNRLRLDLTKYEELTDSVFYELRLVFNKGFHEVAGFFISGKGYPTKAGRNVCFVKTGAYELFINDVNALKEYFVSIANNPDSPLVLRLALFRRTGE